MNVNPNQECKDCQKGIFDKKYKLFLAAIFFSATAIYGLGRIIYDIVHYLNH
jgi:hypothetical protein